MSNVYKLRDCIQAHENDVKSICVLSNDYGFISGSRDLSVRLWKDEFDNFKQEKKYLFHKSYLSVAIYMNPTMRYSDGLILSAGYDKFICGFSPLSSDLEFSLEGHTDTVTSLSVYGMELVSGSMDRTAIIWNLNSNSITGVLKGHGHGIWSVIHLKCIEKGLLTASADKQIYLWDTLSKTKLKQFSGHTDCVRCVVELAEEKQFLSCSNDASIRLWSLQTNSCLKEFFGHSSYIYSMALLYDDNSFVSCGEDGMVLVWDLTNAHTPRQRIEHSAQSIWCVAALNNGDIVTGASDGRIRLFSKNPNFQNGIELAAPKQSNDIVNNSMIRDLPSVGIEVLSLPGEYDEQIVKVKDEGVEVLYKWSMVKDTWLKLTVIDNSNQKATKQTHDHVFSIDIKDGEPPLKLGYNNGEDPWTVAHKFLADNDVSPMFLDQVANFIITNTQQKSTIPTVKETGFSDPFTGGNRYVPDSTVPVIAPSKMFPHKLYLQFDQINAAGLSKKIVEIAGSNNVPDDLLSCIENIHNILATDCPKLTRWVIDRIYEWDTEHLFPLIDLLRMLVKEPVSNSLCFSSADLLNKLINRTIGSHTQCTKANMLTMVKLICNAFSHQCGQRLMLSMFNQLAEVLLRSVADFADSSVMKVACSWFLNMSVLINANYDDSRRTELLDHCFLLLDKATGKSYSDSVHRVLVTIGTLVCNSDAFTFRESLTVGVFDRINNTAKLYQDTSKWSTEVIQCSQQLAQLVSSLNLFNF